MKFLSELKRTNDCGSLRATDINAEVVLMGWVNARREHGGSIFVDLRDRSGFTQCRFDKGIDPAGKMVGEKTSFFLATGAEPAAFDYDRELSRLEMKIKAGAEMVMTQPVYDAAVVERFLKDTRSFGVPILLGICPLVSYRNAEFLHNEVPGMSVPDGIRERMKAAGSGAPGVAEGVAIARDMVETFADRVVGCYFMPQLGRYSSTIDVLRPLGYGEEPTS